MKWTLIILGMALVTYGTKAAILLLGERLTLSAGVRQALGFVPVCVLTAIIVPMVLSPHGGEIEVTWRNPQLVAALAAAAIGALTRHMLLTIGVGLAIFFAWRLWVLA